MDLKSRYTRYKYFSNLLIKIIIVISSITLQSAISKDLSYLSILNNNTKPQKLSIGVDGIYIFTHNKGQYANIFKNTRPGANIYLGFNIEDIMLEVGYLFTSRRSKTTEIFMGNSFLGVIVPQNTRLKGKLRFKNTHIDINFFSKLNNDVKVVTGIGISFLRTSIKLKVTDFNDNDIDYNGKIVGKTNCIPRFGIGIVVNIADNVWCRIMGHFEQHSKAKLKFAPSSNLYKPFKDAYVVLAGLIVKF